MAYSVEALQDLARRKAQAAGIDPDLFVRQITQESNWNPTAVGPKTKYGQAKGLGQFIPGTAQQFGLVGDDVFDPEKNLTASAQYMAQLKQQFGSMDAALAAYNFGPGNVGAGRPWPDETRRYVQTIMGGNPAPSQAELRTAPLNPAPSATLSTSPPVGLREFLTSKLFSSLNTGLPESKAWMGETDLPEKPGPTTMGLLSFGALPLSGGAALAPRMGRLVQALPFLPKGGTVTGLLQNLAMGTVAPTALGAIGEAVSGQEGRDIGETLGAFAPVPRMPTAIANRISGIPIPPIGPLEGTKVLTRQGLAKPMFRGTKAAYVEENPALWKEESLYGPGLYATSAAQNVAEGYMGFRGAKDARKKLINKQQELRGTLKEYQVARQQLAQHYTPDEVTRILDWEKAGGLDAGMADSFSGVDKLIENLPEGTTSLTLPVHIRGKRDAIDMFRLLSNRVAATKGDLTTLKERALGRSKDWEQPNIRPLYLNIKNPLDIDKPVGKDMLTRIEETLAKGQDSPALDWRQKSWYLQAQHSLEDSRQAFPEDVKGVRPYSAMTGGELYRVLESSLPKKDIAVLLQAAGYDGITHIGGGIQGNLKHRVHIAFSPEQAIPYFSPEFSEAQAEQARKLILQRQIKALRAENKMLQAKQAGGRRFLSPADIAVIAHEQRIDKYLEGVTPPADLNPGSLSTYLGTHPLLDHFIKNIQKADAEYQKTGTLSPLLHPANAQGGYVDMISKLVNKVETGSPLNSMDIRMFLTPAGGNQAVGKKWDWKTDFE